MSKQKTHAKTIPSPKIQWQNTCLILDVDGCLVEVNNHTISPKQRKTLKDLHTYLNGGVVFLTDNDMRLVHPMAPFIPIVSEHGTRFRLDNTTPIENAECISPQFDTDKIGDFAAELAQKMKINYSLSHQHSFTSGRILIEKKQSSLGLNYGESQTYKIHALEIANRIISHFQLNGRFTTSTSSADNVEIIPVGFGKETAIDRIMAHPNFKGRIPVKFGDSETDHKVMKKINGQYEGLGIAVGNKITECKTVFERVSCPNGTWEKLEEIQTYLALNSSQKHRALTAQ